MAQLDCKGDENGDCGTVNVVTNTYPHFGMGLPENDLIEEISEQLCLPDEGTLQEPNDAQNTRPAGESNSNLNKQRGPFSGPSDIASALKSIALSYAWGLEGIHFTVPKLFSGPGLSEREADSSLPFNEDENNEGQADSIEKELSAVSLWSKYIQAFPLYQDCCLQPVKADLLRVNLSCLSELVTSQCLPGLRSPLTSCAYVGVTSPPQPTHALEVPLASPPTHSLRVSSWTLWQDLDEVKELGLLNTLTTKEIHLQEAMFEMICSEASYLRSIGIAVNHFYASKTLRETVSRMEHHILFSNLRHVMTASEKFLMDLEVRLGESVVISQVGDIVLQHCPMFLSLYVPYVINMMYQEALVSQLLQENKGFVLEVNKLETDPVCQRQSFKSFLILPFQRITRLKLIMESILRRTEPDSDSISCLKAAIEAIHKIVVKCDEGILMMKQIEGLVHLGNLLDFGDVKSIALIVSGRYLVRQGSLRQLTMEVPQSRGSRMTFIDVYLHLFNDLLIISMKKEQRFSVLDHAVFPTHVHTKQLKTKGLGLPSDSFLLRLSQNHTGQPTALILASHSRSDKEAWMKALSTC